jgi:ATP-dependent protease ClpP protease subunit
MEETFNKEVIVQEYKSRAFVVQLSGDIEMGYITNLIKEIHSLVPSEDDRLEIHISSYGGDLEAAIYFMNTVKLMFGGNIATFLLSNAASAAALIFMVGTSRYVFENSSMMLHTFSMGTFGKATDLHNDVKHNTKRFKRVLKDLFGDSLTKKEYKKIMSGEDYYLEPEQMLDKGIATGLVRFELNNLEETQQDGEEDV